MEINYQFKLSILTTDMNQVFLITMNITRAEFQRNR